jgi:SNF2 family DNA or RNA helicase
MLTVECKKIGRSLKYSLLFPYEPSFIEEIKKIPRERRTFNPVNKSWELRVEYLIDLIKSYKGNKNIFFDFGDKKHQFIEEMKRVDDEIVKKRNAITELKNQKKYWLEFKETLEKKYQEYSENLHKHLKNGVRLYPHQIIAATYANKVKNLLLSHDMGIGKSLTSIAYCEMSGFKKVFVITPNSLKFNYYNEVEKFTESKSHIVNWKKNKHTIEEAKYIIVNYEFFNPSKNFKEKWDKLNIKQIDCLIADECHRLKNTKTNLYKNYKKTFSKNIFTDGNPSKLFLSGTPAPNRAYELYSVMNQISGIDFPTKKHFYEYYCGMTYDMYNGWGYVTNSENTKFEELYHKIAPYTHRKRKEEVLTDLPDKISQKVYLELSDAEIKKYKQVEGDVVDEFIIHEPGRHLTIMGKLRQYLSSIKINHLHGLITDIIENTEEKIVIVDTYKKSLYELKEMFGDVAGLHTGDQSVEERNVIVDNFQNPDGQIRVFLGSIQTCNYGLTLTAANKLFILTLPYTPGEYDQVSSRLHRIGQKDTVHIYPLIFGDTIDEYTYELIEDKKRELSIIMDNKDHVDGTTTSVFGDLVNQLVKKYGKKIQKT